MNHNQRETSCVGLRFNSNLDTELHGYKWARDKVGQSGAAIYRLYDKTDAPELYLKHGTDTVADDITDEMIRLNWLQAFIPVPNIMHFTRTPNDALLLTTAISGKTAFQMLEESPDAQIEIVDALATFLRRLHAVPISGCPFNSNHIFRLALAQKRMNDGLVDADDFDDERLRNRSGKKCTPFCLSLQIPWSLMVTSHLIILFLIKVNWRVALMLGELASQIDTRILLSSGTVSVSFHLHYRNDSCKNMALLIPI